jgi:creatinine amidohydrolase
MSWLDADDATLPQVRAYLEDHPFAILPVGATEQHGPHLPLSTDSLLAKRLAREIAARSGGLVLPVLPFGYSWTWRNVPGTLTLGFETYLDVVRDLCESLSRSGVRAVAIVSGHEANRQPLKYALRERLADRVDIHVLNLFYPGLAEILAQAESPEWSSGMFHADEVETSLMLTTHPERVHMGHAVRDYPAAPADFGSTLTTMGDLMDSGVFGDATLATAAKGARWLDLSAERAAALWRSFLERHEMWRSGDG